VKGKKKDEDADPISVVAEEEEGVPDPLEDPELTDTKKKKRRRKNKKRKNGNLADSDDDQD